MAGANEPRFTLAAPPERQCCSLFAAEVNKAGCWGPWTDLDLKSEWEQINAAAAALPPPLVARPSRLRHPQRHFTCLPPHYSTRRTPPCTFSRKGSSCIWQPFSLLDQFIDTQFAFLLRLNHIDMARFQHFKMVLKFVNRPGSRVFLFE